MEKPDRGVWTSIETMYEDNITSIKKYNLQFFKLFNILALLFLTGMFVSTFFSDYAISLRYVYIGCIALIVIEEVIVNFMPPKGDYWIMPLCYLSMVQIYTFCIISGVFFNRDGVAINYFIFMILLPLSVILRFRSLLTVQTISIAVFCISTYLYKSSGQAAEDILCAIAYYGIGLIVTRQLNKTRIEYLGLYRKYDESERENAILLNSMPAGIMKLKIRGSEITVLYANDPLMKMIGYVSEEFEEKKKWTVNDIAHPDDVQLLKDSMKNPEPGKTCTYDFRLKHKETNGYRWVACKSLIVDVTDDIITVLSDLIDIDMRKQAENASKAKSEFLSRMSHDIRTPLNGIIGLTELAIQENKDAHLQTDLETIASSGRYLMSLINDILDISRIESGKLVLNSVPAAVTEFSNMINSVIRPLADEKHITLNYEMNCGLQCAKIDMVRFNQIFFNLLSNAIKFTQENGHVEFSAKELLSDEKIEWVRFCVEDNGIGMRPEFLNKAFEPFEQEQEHGYSLHQQQGTGLGLAIVRELVSMMGGKVSVESELGRGSKFTVDLPLERCEVPEQEQSKQLQSGNPFYDKHILLVEDNEINILVARRLLEVKGMHVTCAPNGSIALDLYEKSDFGSFDAVLMDIRMPVMDGLEATRRIRASKRADSATIPIIAMSANAYEEDRQLSLEAGMNNHLSKPVEPVVLYQVLGDYITGES